MIVGAQQLVKHPVVVELVISQSPLIIFGQNIVRQIIMSQTIMSQRPLEEKILTQKNSESENS